MPIDPGIELVTNSNMTRECQIIQVWRNRRMPIFVLGLIFGLASPAYSNEPGGAHLQQLDTCGPRLAQKRLQISHLNNWLTAIDGNSNLSVAAQLEDLISLLEETMHVTQRVPDVTSRRAVSVISKKLQYLSKAIMQSTSGIPDGDRFISTDQRRMVQSVGERLMKMSSLLVNASARSHISNQHLIGFHQVWALRHGFLLKNIVQLFLPDARKPIDEISAIYDGGRVWAEIVTGPADKVDFRRLLDIGQTYRGRQRLMSRTQGAKPPSIVFVFVYSPTTPVRKALEELGYGVIDLQTPDALR